MKTIHKDPGVPTTHTHLLSVPSTLGRSSIPQPSRNSCISHSFLHLGCPLGSSPHPRPSKLGVPLAAGTARGTALFPLCQACRPLATEMKGNEQTGKIPERENPSRDLVKPQTPGPSSSHTLAGQSGLRWGQKHIQGLPSQDRLPTFPGQTSPPTPVGVLDFTLTVSKPSIRKQRSDHVCEDLKARKLE